MLKAWLKGIHHQTKQIQPYLDEFTGRFNYRNNLNLFDILLSLMIIEKNTPIKSTFIGVVK
jgi:hypothetical protein